jgi:ferredoxin
MPLEAGFAAFLTPRVIPRQSRCELCMLCQEVCPTGAIGHVPLAQVKMGMAEIDRTQCLVWGDGRKCLLCREQCPVHAIEVDEKKRPVVDDTVCVGCGACENGCPLNEAAITVKPNK